jgi:hypothetical protein
MRTSESATKRKLLAILPLMLSCTLFFAQKSTAQAPLLKTRANTVTLSGIKPSEAITDLNTIIKEPHIITSRPGCTVSGFQISFLPKGADLFGPFNLTGNTLQARQIEYLKKYSGTSMRIFIEEIKVSCNNKEEPEMPIVYKVAIAEKK